jgi:hypothetical protein
LTFSYSRLFLPYKFFPGIKRIPVFISSAGIVNLFIYDLFNDSDSSSHYLASNYKMIMNWYGYGRKRSSPILGFISEFGLEGLRKTTKILRRGSLSPGRYLNPESLK